MRVLIVEPNAIERDKLSTAFTSANFKVTTTDLADEAISLGMIYDFDIILLETQLPDTHGRHIIKKLRTEKVPTPIMVVSHAGAVRDIATALNFGADDYMTKPWNAEELLARVFAVTRRSRMHASNVLDFGPFSIDIHDKTVRHGDDLVPLTGKEYEALALLAQRRNRLITKETFMNTLYGGLDEPEIKIIDVLISKVRKKLSAHCDKMEYITTAWGEGYFMPCEGKFEPKQKRVRKAAIALGTLTA